MRATDRDSRGWSIIRSISIDQDPEKTFWKWVDEKEKKRECWGNGVME